MRRSEAAVLIWSDIERRDDGSGRLLIEGSTADQTGVGEVAFITRRAMATLEISRATAVSGPTPRMRTRAGAAIRVSRSSSVYRSRISLSSRR